MRPLSCLTLILASLGGLLGAVNPAQATPDSMVCGEETSRQETAIGIPRRLLHAISLVESGRWDAERRVSFAWPWTITAEGEGRFLPTKRAAVEEVRRLQAQGVRNIDVGCMQINLLAHPDAFGSLDEAFEPTTNVAYAARFLMDLYRDTGNWPTAGAYYHSQTPDLANAYKTRLMTTWTQALGRRDDPLQLASTLDHQPPLGTLPWPLDDHVTKPAAAAAAAAATASKPQLAAAERAVAKRLADAYRQARLDEYRQRRTQSAGG